MGSKIRTEKMKYKVSWFATVDGKTKILEYVPKDEEDAIAKQNELLSQGVRESDMYVGRMNPENGDSWYHSYGHWYRITNVDLAPTRTSQPRKRKYILDDD